VFLAGNRLFGETVEHCHVFPEESDHMSTESIEPAGQGMFPWPPARWRHEFVTRNITAGTLLGLAANLGGIEEGEKALSPGVTVENLVMELRRIQDRYFEETGEPREERSGRSKGGKRITGQHFETDVTLVVMLVAALVEKTGVIAYAHVGGTIQPDKFSKVKVTSEGIRVLNLISMSAAADERFEAFDLVSDPVAELDVSPEAADFDYVLPGRRLSNRRPTYRQWLWIVLNNPAVWSVVAGHVSPRHEDLVCAGQTVGDENLALNYRASLTDRERADSPDTGMDREIDELRREWDAAEGKKVLVGDLPAAYWAARMQAEYMRPFAREVLGGGPEAMWAGKPIKADAVHNDVESFAAASRTGFKPDGDMVGRSSLAWELYDKMRSPMSAYVFATEEIEAAARAAELAESVVPVSGAVSLEAEMGKDRVRADAVIGVLDPKRFSTGENVAMRRVGDALVDTIKGVSPAAMSRNRKGILSVAQGGLVRVRCDYIYDAADEERRRGCAVWATPGTSRCAKHGGLSLDQEEMENIVAAGRANIVAASVKAIETVVDLLDESTNDMTRLGAAKLLIDKSGIDLGVSGPGVTVKAESAGDVVRERLSRLSSRPDRELESRAQTVSPQPDADGIVDAEVVE
jgi:hypothetical protein